MDGLSGEYTNCLDGKEAEFGAVFNLLTSSIRTLLPASLLSASSIKGFCFFFSGSSGVGVNEELQSKALHKLRFNHKSTAS